MKTLAKTSNSLKIATLLTAIFMLSTFTASFAGTKKLNSASRTVVKAREIVANAAPDDWYSFAMCAKKCINKKVNLKEASEWLEQSIKIKETAFNMEVKGDYYVVNNMPEEAIKCYIKSISLGESATTGFDEKEIQQKIQATMKSKK